MDKDLSNKFDSLQDAAIASNSFSFYTSVVVVFLSKIASEPIELDSYSKHKKYGIQFLPDYKKKVDDLCSAYTFAKTNQLNKANSSQAHKLLSNYIFFMTSR